MKRILIVDDSRSLRQAVAITLRKANFEVSEAENGQSALALMSREASFDLVISDFNMPGMDGLTFIRELKERPDCEYTPVLMLTTENGEQRMNEGMAAGVSVWLTKPFMPEQLLGVIERLL